jgi:chromosomal replication initiation ATPase DnaA
MCTDPGTISSGLRAVSESYDIPQQFITGPGRIAIVAEARQMFWFILRISTGAPYSQLTLQTNRRPSSASHACKQVPWLIKTYPQVRNHYNLAVTRFLTLTRTCNEA